MPLASNPQAYREYRQPLKVLEKSERDSQLAELVGGGMLPSPLETILKDFFWSIIAAPIMLAALWARYP